MVTLTNLTFSGHENGLFALNHSIPIKPEEEGSGIHGEIDKDRQLSRKRGRKAKEVKQISSEVIEVSRIQESIFLATFTS
jgi:hypothetical protein